jgi:hypothetical protein
MRFESSACIRQHTSAYVSMLYLTHCEAHARREHCLPSTSAGHTATASSSEYLQGLEPPLQLALVVLKNLYLCRMLLINLQQCCSSVAAVLQQCCSSVGIRIRRHTSAYASIRQRSLGESLFVPLAAHQRAAVLRYCVVVCSC